MSVEQLQKVISPKFTEQVLVECVAKKSGLSDVQITNIQIRPGSKMGGDSYQSNMVKLTLEAVGQNAKNEKQFVAVPVIVKHLPANLAHRKTFRSVDFFRCEINFFENVWSALDGFQKSKNLPENFDKIPLALACHCDGLTDFIVMDDLTCDGYENPTRCSGLDYNNTIVMLKILAEFNGLSLAFKDQQPSAFEKAASSLQENFYSEELRSWYGRFQKDVLFVVYRDAVAKELPALYLEKFDEILANDVYGKACELVQRRGPLAVVAHGDIWLPNFMFKYQSDKTRIETAKIIDFQLARYASLSTDLLNFLLSCVDNVILEQHYDDFLAEYIKASSQVLKKLGSDPNLITLDELKSDLKTNTIYAMALSMEAIMNSLLGDDEVADLDEIEGDEKVPLEQVLAVKPFTNQEKRKRLAAMIKFIVDKKLI